MLLATPCFGLALLSASIVRLVLGMPKSAQKSSKILSASEVDVLGGFMRLSANKVSAAVPSLVGLVGSGYVERRSKAFKSTKRRSHKLLKALEGS